jgi:Reverse transcriptase (RNA-dependent DNA polymerase)
LAEHIHDGRFLQLIERMLNAGYLEDWRWNATLSGCPQGGIASPVMSNIYLDRFDRWVEQRLIPEYNKGRRRRLNPSYQRANSQIRTAKRRGDRETARTLQRARRDLPSQDPDDPGYRRLGYVRYCDDFLLGFAGPKHEAEEIKAKIRAFLRDELKLELSEPKTLITHAASQAARFLGYEIRTQRADTKITRGRRMVNGKIGLFVPRDVIRERCARLKGFSLRFVVRAAFRPPRCTASDHDLPYGGGPRIGLEATAVPTRRRPRRVGRLPGQSDTARRRSS